MSLVGTCTSSRDGVNGTSNQVVLTFPTTGPLGPTQAGDVCTIVSSSNVTNTATAGCISGSDWTIKHGLDNGGNVIRSYVWSHALTQAEVNVGAVTVQWASAGRVNGIGQVMRGVTPADGTGAGYGYIGSDTLAMPTVDTVADNSDIIVVTITRVINPPAALVTLPSGWTKDGNSSTGFTSGVNFNSVAGHLTTPGPAGTYGGGTLTTSPAATNMTAYLIVLTPDVPAPTDPDGLIIGGAVKQLSKQGLIVGGSLKAISRRGVITSGQVLDL